MAVKVFFMTVSSRQIVPDVSSISVPLTFEQTELPRLVFVIGQARILLPAGRIFHLKNDFLATRLKHCMIR